MEEGERLCSRLDRIRDSQTVHDIGSIDFKRASVLSGLIGVLAALALATPAEGQAPPVQATSREIEPTIVIPAQ